MLLLRMQHARRSRLSLRDGGRNRQLLSAKVAVGRLQAGWARSAADDPAHGGNHDIMAQLGHLGYVLAQHRMIWS
jgi:hypothetical protein